MGFLKTYGIVKAVTAKDENERLAGIVMACLDNDDSDKYKKKNNVKTNKYDKYGRPINRNRCEEREDN